MRHWFLLLLVSGIAIGCLWPESVQVCVGWIPARAIVALVLFLMAWGLPGQRLWDALRCPWPALWAVVVSSTFLPLLAYLAGLLAPHPDLGLGLLIISCVPCTFASAVLWTRLGEGNEATALLAVAFSTSLGWLVAPLWLTLAPSAGEVASGNLVVPNTWSMMQGLILVLIVPVTLAQASRVLPAIVRGVEQQKVLLGVVVRLLIFSMVLRGSVSLAHLGKDKAVSLGSLPWSFLLFSLGACATTHLLALWVGWQGSRVLGFARANTIAVAFACSQKTLPVALYLYEMYYRREHPLAILPIVIYHAGQLIMDTGLAEHLAQREQQTEATKPRSRSPGDEACPEEW